MVKRTIPFVISIALAAASGFAYQDTSDPQTPPDNTKVNKRDRSKDAPTADQQSNHKTDRELTQKIRKAIVKDKDLSTYAHNVKIIARNGDVTLKGPVRSEEEKKTVEAKATEAGASSVDNQLEVTPPHNSK